MTKYIKFGLSVAIATMVCGGVRAADISPLMTQDPQAIESRSGWEFSVAPYFWMAGLSGDTSQFGLPTVHMDADFGDILSNLDFAFMAAGEARNDRFSVIADVIYTKLSANGETPGGILANSVDVTTSSFSGLLDLGYSVLGGPEGHLDVVGGVKVWSVDTTLSFNGGILGGIERSDGATWVDGMVGLRGKLFLHSGNLSDGLGPDRRWRS